MKTVDFFIGVKAEQSLREAVRQSAEALPSTESDTEGELELCPVGRKDWIAGIRFKGPLPLRELEPLLSKVLKKLLLLESFQRIRFENISVYSVQEPVPVFKEVDVDGVSDHPTSPSRVEPESRDDEPKAADPNEPVDCPLCGRRVHPFNARFNRQGKIVGCSFCA